MGRPQLSHLLSRHLGPARLGRLRRLLPSEAARTLVGDAEPFSVFARGVTSRFDSEQHDRLPHRPRGIFSA
ncbi:hypothetical protein KZ829_17905 [Actinoplanes hulinensis]|uniref:Uncharacterized protein n=1 Tax=Actinoplanes hulinensis TaxID=1144547 RepID=A0ABS7B3Q2_9ACTN|nr:hypothetical protein [Actinoplanes hulinensis]MBW6435618.1 hypothetical protein [Actinoplanes hulinensis]